MVSAHNRIVKGEDAYSDYKKRLPNGKLVIAVARETIAAQGQDGGKDETEATLAYLMKESQIQFRVEFP